MNWIRPEKRRHEKAIRRLVKSLENGRTDTARRCAEIAAVVHGCGVAYNRILREFGLTTPEDK